MEPWGIHWFRRDLRLTGNPALAWNCKKHGGRVLGIYCIDPAVSSLPGFSVNRFIFTLNTLLALREEMQAAGGDLLVLNQAPQAGFAFLVDELKRQKVPLPSVWSCNRDYEPFVVARDAQIQMWIESGLGAGFHTERDHLLIEPQELYKGDERGTYYQIYTPFKKKWLSLFASDEMQDRLKAGKRPTFKVGWDAILSRSPSALIVDALDRIHAEYSRRATVPLPAAGDKAALARLKQFNAKALVRYAHDRDIPALPGTSRISVYLKNGSLTVAQAIAAVSDARATVPAALHARGGDTAKFMEELIWREFYYHILVHVPRVEQSAFNFKYEGLPWTNDPVQLAAWRAGRTGFPIVDAGMREMRETGWMHNRLRMVVASFLTKDLHCDWKLGERFFMEHLLDGDLASNNGGWQWAASTGCDPQPYFRIFNPVLQSRRFDPEGTYIRRWVPELRGCSAKEIHEPWAKGSGPADYPRPIVQHAAESKKAVAMYRGRKQG